MFFFWIFILICFSFVRAKVEDDADAKESDNPEFHFSSFEGDSSVLESGLQLLHSLEAEEKYVTYVVELFTNIFY